MIKKSLGLLFITTVIQNAIAEEVTQQTTPPKVFSENEVLQLKTEWLAEQQVASQDRLKQRANFLQLESLLQAAQSQDKLSSYTLSLARGLVPKGYPLQEDMDWLFLKAELAMADTEKSVSIIKNFTSKYPAIAERNQLDQIPFSLYFDRQQFEDLVAYAETYPARTVENQCRVFGAQYQLLAEKIQPNPEAEQAGNRESISTDSMTKLLQDFEAFWLLDMQSDFWKNANSSEKNYWRNHASLPDSCGGLESYWKDSGLKTAEKVKTKALELFALNSSVGLKGLISNTQDKELAEWLEMVDNLKSSPKNLQTFVQNAPLDEWNKRLVVESFSSFIRTFPEQTEKSSFADYQQWAEKWQLTQDEINDWKVAMLNRLFDNNDPTFQQWRDDQIKQLKVDSLTERRLRIAIREKADLNPWLALLSDESKNKQEWQYWQAKASSDQAQREAILKELITERGFYPMLAAQLLKQPYILDIPPIKSLTQEQKAQFGRQLDRIQELRILNRLGTAKLAWGDLLQAVSFEEQLALSEYALQQDWYDLVVDGTIKSKAWDHIQLRLPNAYSDWFDLNLANKPIQKSFAMAIARQESAWNFQIRSHANAIGLMQMLPTTASETAKNNELVYSGERDLVLPFNNIMLGTTHLTELNQKYPNNRILIASAYNAGARRADQWLERANGKLDMDEFIATIPFYETRGYVENVLAYDYYYQTLYGKGDKTLFYKEEQRKY
ncbi:transglycosylase SLT domain-containing protein [Otariodibacter oris]|uniref:Soluble lytic murein transglycosylase n=1 Tax=Otariodibacter oris TaxID=1032623 RepID=A0A420XJP1_9PAST|nr:transglycosylase SLT domain-containing protein [Otariodibacter oris]QGM80527.1 lytic murein transglycosylase [Otariodibacter oris]RKR77320.1 soluble lytic murein transglycosylase [Otariodibacter oris]